MRLHESRGIEQEARRERQGRVHAHEQRRECRQDDQRQETRDEERLHKQDGRIRQHRLQLLACAALLLHPVGQLLHHLRQPACRLADRDNLHGDGREYVAVFRERLGERPPVFDAAPQIDEQRCFPLVPLAGKRHEAFAERHAGMQQDGQLAADEPGIHVAAFRP